MKRFGFLRRVIAGFLLLALSARPALLHAARAELIYDGNLVQKADLQSFGGTEYLSVKSAAALFKGKTQWYPIAGKVILQVNNYKIAFAADSRSAQAGSRKISLGGRARLVKGVMLVPAEFFASSAFEEMAECKVTWDAGAQILDAEPRVTLSQPRVYSRPRSTRIVFESTEDFVPEFRKKDRTVTADIPKARIGGEETIKVNDGAVKSVSLSGERRGASIRVVLADQATSYAWTQEKRPRRLVLEVRNPKAPVGPEEDAPAQVAESTETSEPALGPAAPPESVVANTPKKSGLKAPSSGLKNIRRIVVDAGHGGKDAGAVGKSGTKEKDINLLIALELARILRVEGEYEVMLTRSDDTFVPLVDRSLFANQNKADLFISIHCNASVSKSQSGFEVYYLSENASDPHAEATEELENSVVALEGPKSTQKLHLQEVLFSMAQNEFINQSSLLCNAIAKSVERRTSVHDRGIKQANFHVLHGAQMPAVLIETAFITNPGEEGKLRQRKFRSAVVDAILTAVQDYEKKIQVLYGRPK